MDEITVETAKFMIAQGALGVMCLYLAWRNVSGDKRFEDLVSKFVESMEKTAEALTAIKERIK